MTAALARNWKFLLSGLGAVHGRGGREGVAPQRGVG